MALGDAILVVGVNTTEFCALFLFGTASSEIF